MNILITGASGQLGRELRELVPREGEDRYIFSDVLQMPGVETIYLDISDSKAVSLVCESEQVDLIVNCAAYTNVDAAEDNRIEADMLNREAVLGIARICRDRDIRLMQISTDYVFDGMRSEAYREYSEPAPLNYYGMTKANAERDIMSSGCAYMIIRTSWMYSPFGKNFLRTILSLTSERPSFRVVCDQIGTPTYARDLASFIMKVISERRFSAFGRRGDAQSDSGIYHYSDEGVASWYDFASCICALAARRDKERNRMPRTCTVLPCHSSEYPTKAQRPLFSLLDKTKVKETFSITIPHWMASLADCMERIED